MKELENKYRQDKDYRELFRVMIDSHICEDTAVGITNDGQHSSAYWMQSISYSIDKEEFRSFLKTARSRGYVEQAIQKGRTTENELEKLSE